MILLLMLHTSWVFYGTQKYDVHAVFKILETLFDVKNLNVNSKARWLILRISPY